jgi:hypothetical protein
VIAEEQVRRIGAEPLSAEMLHIRRGRDGVSWMGKSVREAMAHKHHLLTPELEPQLPITARSYPASPDPALVSIVDVYLRPKAFGDLGQPVLEVNEQLPKVEPLGEAVGGHGWHSLAGLSSRWFNVDGAVEVAPGFNINCCTSLSLARLECLRTLGGLFTNLSSSLRLPLFVSLLFVGFPPLLRLYLLSNLTSLLSVLGLGFLQLLA